jgi:hypothetical protein
VSEVGRVVRGRPPQPLVDPADDDDESASSSVPTPTFRLRSLRSWRRSWSGRKHDLAALKFCNGDTVGVRS